MEEKPVKEIIQQIAFECQESGATKWEILKVIKELEESKAQPQQLRKKAAEVLQKLNPSAAKTFLSFEKLRVFTSREKREAFDRGNIIKSLLKETKVSRAVAEKIGSEVEDKIKDLNLEYLNTQIIREMVNVKLLDYGHEQIHNEYARIGMPVYEVEKKLAEKNFESGEEILREYNWLKTITGKARELHFDSTIHIFNAEDFSTKIFCNAQFFSEKKEDIALLAKKADEKTTIPITVNALNMMEWQGTGKAKEQAELIDKIFSITGKKRIAELALFNDYEWANHSGKKEQSVKLANAILNNQNQSIIPVIGVDSKYKIKLIEKKYGKILIENHSKERTSTFQFGCITGNTSLIQLIGINLQKMLEQSLNEEMFFETLNETLSICTELSEKKRTILEKTEGFTKQELESGTGIALAGLLNASKALNETNPGKVASEIISAAQKQDYSVIDLNTENVLTKFGITESKAEKQALFLQLNSKHKKSFGFKYETNSMKEAEEMLEELPLIEINLSHDKSL
ncbi:MAG TPA: ATP cone domain-containing protein [archaeon]|nr:ATP cone domain-containing protein [archaeon]